MTLGELADLVCTKIHRSDDQSVIEAKKYLRSRYEMIWNSNPWRDAMCEVLIPSVDVQRTIILPVIVDRVQNVLFDDRPIPTESMQFIYQVAAFRFGAPADPSVFVTLAPSALAASPGGSKLKLVSESESATGKASIRGLLGNDEVSETVTLTGTEDVLTSNDYDVVFQCSKASTAYGLSVKDEDDNTLLSLRAPETHRSHQRIDLITIPQSEKTISVLGKRRIKPMIEDSDSPELTGIDNALLAFAIGDMWESQRQYGKAQIKFGEGSSMISQMADLERRQSASVIRLVPQAEDYDWRGGCDDAFPR